MYNEPALLQGLTAINPPVFAINPGFKPNDYASFDAHGVDLTVVGNVGHFVMLEDPERFNQSLTSILARVTNAS